MSENVDLDSNNLCIPEDTFDQFQAISMYQEEEYIALTEIGPSKPKNPEPGELSHLSYDNEVVVTTENEVNSTVKYSTEQKESSEKQILDNSLLETSVSVAEKPNNLEQDNKPQNASRRGRKKKQKVNNDENIVSNDIETPISNQNSHNMEENTKQESPIISSTVPRKRGRKPKPRPCFPLEEQSDVPKFTEENETSNILITSFSSDPENSDAVTAVVKRKRGRPRKTPLPNEKEKELSSELSSSDNNNPNKFEIRRRRGRPRKISLETNLDSQITPKVENPEGDIRIEQLEEVVLNKSQHSDEINKTGEVSSELESIEQGSKLKSDSENKIISSISISENDVFDNMSLSKLKQLPDTNSSADENHSTENNKDLETTKSRIQNTVEISNVHPPLEKVKKSRGKKDQKGHSKKQSVETIEKLEPVMECTTLICTTTQNIIEGDDDDDDADNLSLSKLKEIKSDTSNTEINNTNEVSKTDVPNIEDGNNIGEVNGTPNKRNTKMPIMSDFEYNIDSVLGNEATTKDKNAENNSLLVEDTSKRPIRRKVQKLRYDEESDEDPFANVELSDDDEPKRRKGNRYYSDDEYVPGRRGNEDVEDSTDSETNTLIDETKKQRKKKMRKRSDNQSPRKRGKKDNGEEWKKGDKNHFEDSDDIEICLPSSVLKASDDSQQSQPSKAWGASNEFENFLAKKIQGTNLKIKKVSSSEPTENKTLEIPTIDPAAKKTVEMCSQTSIISTVSTGIQTSSPYEIPMKENINLTAEQSEKACYFLNSIVKTTAELGSLMTQKSEDFIKKKINTTHVTDTMKMDYCVKKSFLLFKLAKHNLMQMEEDLAKQYEEFLKANNLSACREVPKVVVPTAKQASSDSDCEIVEEPVVQPKPPSNKKSQEKPRFNPKTVFLNKELSIKIAKKPTENKKLDIKGRHTVWINDTVMVKKVKPTQSFLAQDSRNKKPPDNKITTEMVSYFFKNYYRQRALSVCAPFISTDWLNMSKECICNYFVVKPVQIDTDVNYIENDGISTNNTSSNASASDTIHDLNAIKIIDAITTVTCPEPLFKLCFRIVESQMRDLNRVKEVCQHIRNEITDGKEEPVTLFRLCLRSLTGRAVDIPEESPAPSKKVLSDKTSQFTVLPLKTLCHRKIMALLYVSNKRNFSEDQESLSDSRCSTQELIDIFPTCTPKHLYTSSYVRNGVKSLLSLCLECIQKEPVHNNVKSLISLCVEFIQREQVNDNDTSNISISKTKSLQAIAFAKVKQMLYGENYSIKTSLKNLLEHNDRVIIEGLTINSINTLSEEAFLNLEHSHTEIPDSPNAYVEDFDNEDHFEHDFNEHEEVETSWVNHVQMKELRSCFITTNPDENQEENIPIITQIKIEPLDDPIPENIDSLAPVKTEPEPGPGLDEMTMIPDIKPEVMEDLGTETLNAERIQRQNSNSYDVNEFEQFVATNKIMHELNNDIFSQSALRVRRQHEPDYEEENDTSDVMSLLIPQTYEPMTIETAKGRLMDSSSEDENSKLKKIPGKKKPDKRKAKQKKTDMKTNNKDTPTTLTKEKVINNEVATLTRRMRDKIRQEEKKDNSTDSENEEVSVRLRSKKEQEKTKQTPTNKSKDTEIQCNNVDSTDQVDDDVTSFTGFTAIDQNEISTYQKYMKYVYDKIIPEKANTNSKKDNATLNSKEDKNNASERPLINYDDPVELLECEPTMPFFDDAVCDQRSFRKTKCKETKKENLQVKNELLMKEVSKKEEDLMDNEIIITKARISRETASFIDRHGWQCYRVDPEDSKLYNSACVALEKLPESFVQTYFEYQGITRRDKTDEEIDRLTNLTSLNRTTAQLKDYKTKIKSKREAKSERTSEKSSEAGSRVESPTYSDHYDELEPSDDERRVEDETAPPAPQKQSENTLAKNLLMGDNDSDSAESVKVKQEPLEDINEVKNTKTYHSKGKKKENVIEDSSELMLTADKVMNKELNLLHAPIVLKEDVKDTPSKGPITRNKQKSASKNPPSTSKIKNEEDSSSEEEKQWVTTKEKLLKRLGKKEDASADDAKRAKLVNEFIERRGGLPDSHIRSLRTKSRRSSKKFLERQKQLRVLSRELFGESADGTKRSQKAQASLLYKGRRNIRKVIDKKSLARSTVVANMEEFERKRRLNARQTKLRELLGCEEDVNVLVINDEVCLEYDFEENRPIVTIHPFFTKVMKAHQYEGVKFMWDACFESLAEIEAGHPGGGCILAHCMGLGKTLQVLALLHTVLTHPRVGMQRVLVCCPLSTVLNWVDEIHKWIGPVTNQIKVFELSKLKKTYERAYQLEDWYNGGGIFIIGYELFRSLSTLDPFLDDVRPTIINKIRTALLDPGPDIIVCDEGHLLKNDCSVLAVAMSRVVTKRRIVLTGTPMQNNLREYYCMVNFVKPNLLGTYAEYSNRFENPIMNGQHRDSREEDIKLMKARTHILHKVLEGCLQRQEASVLYPYLPKKHEYTVFITLTQCQWDLYKHYLNHYGKQSKQSILKDFHILQKIWSHPQVLHNFQTKARDRDEKNRIKAEKLEDDLATEDQEEIKPNTTELWWLEYLDGGNMLETLDSSNKFVVVFRILDECIALGDKVLIFSTSLFCLDALEYFLKKINKWSLGQEYYRLDGSVPPEVRQKWCREFNADNNYKTKLFLVSTRAGCLGLNMTAANRVIIMDTSWNPAHDIQSIFRVYRFGQKKDCYIYRLVAMGTMEQKIYERSVTKQAVACRVVDEQQIDRHYNMAELTELYKFDEAGASVAGGVAVGVADVALLRVARHAALHAVHEHDSLLRGSSEQGLPEHERNAAWMQFQQEQAHKQIENKLVVNIPTVPNISLKRVHGHDYALNHAPLTEIKTEDTTNDFVPSEPKAKKGKKNAVIKCSIPIQDGSVTTEIAPVKQEFQPPSTRGRPRNNAPRPGSSKEPDHVPTQPLDPKQEEVMVEKITDILLKHNFQNRKGNTEISNLVMKVRNMVRKGYVTDEDKSDDLTASIARILLPKQITLPKVTDIMCESINNSAAPNKGDEEEPELITSDPTPTISDHTPQTKNEPESKKKRKAAIAAEKSIDSLAQDIIINLDDEEWDAGDIDFLPTESEKTEKQNGTSTKVKKKGKSRNTSPLRILEDYERTVSVEPSPERNVSDVNCTTNCDIVKKTNKVDKDKQPVERLKPKDRSVAVYTHKKRDSNTVSKMLTVDDEATTSKTVEPDKSDSILLSDDDEPILNLNPKNSSRKGAERPPGKPAEINSGKSVENPPAKALEKSADKFEDEVVPLPITLLKNQNFINIVAHTYLVGNPMLDEDAATLAAQYSTLKAFKEAEQTGKDVCSGPIYDIAVKVIGKEVLKKMHSVNPKAATSSAIVAAASIQKKEQMIASELKHKTSIESAKTKNSNLRNDMLKEKLGMRKPLLKVVPHVTMSHVSTSNNQDVVPVGLVKAATPAPASGMFNPPGVMCILPDNDDMIISDTPPAPPPAPAPPSNKPIVMNQVLFKAKKLHETYPVKVTVGGGASAAATPASQPVPPTRIVLQTYPTRLTQPQPSAAPSPPLNTQTISQSTIPVAAKTILSTNDTICLDSDDEEAASSPTPSANPISINPAQLQQQPVPVSLTMANTAGIKVPLPAMPNLAQSTAINTSQTLVLRQVAVPGSSQPKFVLIPSDKLPTPTLPVPVEQETPPTPTSIKLNTSQSESLFSLAKDEITKKINSTRCKTGDILRISKTGKIEVIKSTDSPKPPPASANTTSVPVAAPTYKPIAPKPSTSASASASIDLTSASTESAKPMPAPSPKTDTNKNQKKVDGRRVRQISSSSGSSSNSRPSSPDNPLSILRDVVQIRAPDYPSTSKSAQNTNSGNKSIVLRTEKSTKSNISVQHVVSSGASESIGDSKKSPSLPPGVMRLTKVPKDQVPKHVDIAVNKQTKKDDLVKKIKPLLTMLPKGKDDPKQRGKNIINSDNLNSKIQKSIAVAGKMTDKKDDPKILRAIYVDSNSSFNNSAVVDLTNIVPSGTSVLNTKADTKKRTAAVADMHTIKKKKSDLMTLKDFNLDDIDDIIELD